MKKTYIILILLIILIFSQDSFAEKWHPFEFKGTEKFNYLIKIYEGEELSQEMEYIVELNPTDETNKSGEKLYEVSYTRKDHISESRLGDQIFFGYSGFEMIGFFINPMYYPMISDLDIEVGEKALIYGIGKVNITGKEKVYGREGFVCELYSTGDEEQLMAIFIIEPKISMPLKVTVYNDIGEINSEVSLVEYRE
ncbi:MAG TPA: hypothetical protein VJ907_01070 [Halanaerobiales bacterium]|nr:hypothetical protein [Halanaerobiales bacterium]